MPGADFPDQVKLGIRRKADAWYEYVEQRYSTSDVQVFENLATEDDINEPPPNAVGPGAESEHGMGPPDQAETHANAASPHRVATTPSRGSMCRFEHRNLRDGRNVNCGVRAMKGEPQSASVGDPRSELERAYIAEFLQDRGHTLNSARALPPAEAHALLQQASVYASCRLTEVESRAHFVDDMHTPGVPARRH